MANESPRLRWYIHDDGEHELELFPEPCGTFCYEYALITDDDQAVLRRLLRGVPPLTTAVEINLLCRLAGMEEPTDGRASD